MNVETYQHAIEREYERLEERKLNPKIVVSPIATSWMTHKLPKVAGRTILGIGATVMTAGFFFALDAQETGRSLINGLGMFGCLFGGGAGLVSGIVIDACREDEYSRDRFAGYLNPFLGLFGRTLPISDRQVKQLTTWMAEHPRLVETLGKWAASNPSGQLTLEDYRAVEKTTSLVKRLQEKQTLIEQQVARGQAFEGTGLGAATRKAKLEKMINGQSQQAGSLADSTRNSSKPSKM